VLLKVEKGFFPYLGVILLAVERMIRLFNQRLKSSFR